jgi:hypothetical protein
LEKVMANSFLEEIPAKGVPVLSLFSGAGGLDLGFEQAGFTPILALDKDPVAVATYNWNRRGKEIAARVAEAKKRTYSVSELPVQTYRDVVAGYLRHPEVKAAGGDGVGVLQPLHIAVTDTHQIRHIGKEANQLDEVQVLGLQADTYLHYQDQDAHKEWIRQKVKVIPIELVSRHAGLSKRQIARFLSVKSRVRKDAMARLVRIVEIWEMVGGDEDRFVRILTQREGL